MIKKAFILCTTKGDAIIQNGKVTCKSEDGLKEFMVECDLLENVIIEPFLIMIDDTVYSIPTDEYIPVGKPQTNRGDPKPRLPARRPQRVCERFGSQRWTIPSTRKLIELVQECSEDNQQHVFITQREKWRHIARQMTRYGYRMNEIQAKNRLKSLHRAYRNTKGKDSASKKSSVMRYFKRELHALFGNKCTNTAQLLVEPLEQQSGNTESHQEANAKTLNLMEEDYLVEEEGEEFELSHNREHVFDATVPSAATCHSLLSTVNEMEDAIYTLGEKIDEGSWGTAELLCHVRQLVASSSLIKKKIIEGASTGGNAETVVD